MNHTTTYTDKYPSMSPYAYCAWNPVKYVDPEGKEKVISYITNSKNKDDNKNERLIKGANNFPENDGVIHLFAHGSTNEEGVATGIKLFYSNLNIEQIIDNILLFENYLIEYSQIYNKNEREKTSILVLHSCGTGKGDNSFAEQLSKELNLLVVAPSENVRTDYVNGKNKEVGVYKADAPTNDLNMGVWNIFYKGKLMGCFSGKTPPVFSNPQKTIEKYEKMYNDKYGEVN